MAATSLALLLLPATLSLSPTRLLQRMQEHHAGFFARSDDSRSAEHQPDPRYGRLRALLAQSKAAKSEYAFSSESVAAKGPMYARAATDGELLEEGVEELLKLLQPSKDAVFADLGSGRAEALTAL